MQTILKNLHLLSDSKERNINLSDVSYMTRDNLLLLRKDISFEGLNKEVDLLLMNKDVIFLINNINFSPIHFKFLLSSYNKTNNEYFIKLLKNVLKLKNFSIHLERIYEVLKDYNSFEDRTFLICEIIKYLDIEDMTNDFRFKDMLILYMKINNGKLSRDKILSSLSNEYKLRLCFSSYAFDLINNNVNPKELIKIIPYVSINEFDDLDFLVEFCDNNKILLLLSSLYFDLNTYEEKTKFIFELSKLKGYKKERFFLMLLNLSTKINKLSFFEFNSILLILDKDLVLDDVFEYIYKNNKILFNENLKVYHIDFLKENLNKKSFIKLVENNIDIFSQISKNNILLKIKPNSFLNLNTLNRNNIITLLKYTSTSNNKVVFENIKSAYDLDKLKTLTFNEFWFLLSKDIYISKLFYKLYDLNIKIDLRLKLLKELPNLTLAFKKWNLDDKKIDRLLNRLCLLIVEKSFKDRINLLNLENNNLKTLNNEDYLFLILNFHLFTKFINEIKHPNDIYYIFDYSAEIKKTNVSLFNFKEEKLKKDFYYKYLIKELELSKPFINKYNHRIIDFCENQLHEVFYYFMNNINQENLQKENMKKIVKAEIMGILKEIKFIDKDFNLEIGLEVPTKIKKEWKNNIGISYRNESLKETYDFKDIIRLGEIPVNTCQHWNGGEYSKCLLSNFDTNKKMIINSFENKVNARALIRLTKGSFDTISTKLSFSDVNTKGSNRKNKEHIVLFLEKTYSDLDKVQLLKVKKNIIELAKKKADLLNIPLVVSEFYKDVLTNETLINYNLFISYSKNGYQYLDSLNGQAEAIEEGTYYPCYVYMI